MCYVFRLYFVFQRIPSTYYNRKHIERQFLDSVHQLTVHVFLRPPLRYKRACALLYIYSDEHVQFILHIYRDMFKNNPCRLKKPFVKDNFTAHHNL